MNDFFYYTSRYNDSIHRTADVSRIYLNRSKHFILSSLPVMVFRPPRCVITVSGKAWRERRWWQARTEDERRLRAGGREAEFSTAWPSGYRLEIGLGASGYLISAIRAVCRRNLRHGSMKKSQVAVKKWWNANDVV